MSKSIEDWWEELSQEPEYCDCCCHAYPSGVINHMVACCHGECQKCQRAISSISQHKAHCSGKIGIEGMFENL